MTALSPVAIARVVHEANRALQIALDDPRIGVAPPWDEESPETQGSVIDGVQAILTDPSVGPVESHENWCAYKRAHGWTYGPVKDTTARTHPCLVPYQDLPASDRVKDALFGAIVRALA